MVQIDRLSEITNCEFRSKDVRILGEGVLSIMMTCRGIHINPRKCLGCNA